MKTLALLTLLLVTAVPQQPVPATAPVKPVIDRTPIPPLQSPPLLPGVPSGKPGPGPATSPPPMLAQPTPGTTVDMYLLQAMRAQDARIDALEKRVQLLEAAQKAPVKK